MNKAEINNIFVKNSDDKLSTYLSILLSKCKDIDKESNYISILMLLLISLFYISDYSKAESLQIGPLSIKDLNSIKVFIPLVLAFLIFRYIVISSHKAELNKIIREFSKNYFNHIDSKTNQDSQIDELTRSILPFSPYTEINNLTYKGKSKFGCFGGILILPIIVVLFVPLYLEYIWIKAYIITFSSLNFIQKTSIIVSIWILLVTFYFIIQNAIINIKENK